MKRRYQVLGLLLIAAAAGCALGSDSGVTNINRFSFPDVEPEWIRSGEPLIFEDEKWFPQDQIDVLRDGEVLLMGDYKDTQFFVERLDVRPFNRLYTKFGANKFRVFRRRVSQ